MTRNAGLYLALRIGQAALPFIPLRLAYAAATFLGRLSYYLLPAPRRAIEANLTVVLGSGAARSEVRARAREAFETDAKNWVDTIRIARLTNQEILDIVDVEGWERAEAAISAEKGLILVVVHLGNFDLVGNFVTAHGYRLTVPVERMKPDSLFRFLLAQRASKGIKPVPVDEAPRALIRALRSGEVVAVAGDRNIAGKTVVVPFFGRPTALPRGPVALARRTGAPMLVGVAIRTPSNSFHGYVSAPVDIKRSADAVADDLDNTGRLAQAMESYIGRFPGQWLSFSPVWGQTGVESAGTMEHKTEATV